MYELEREERKGKKRDVDMSGSLLVVTVFCPPPRLRESLGLNTFAFRPHCGESGNIAHLATSYLLAESINHGVRLQQSPSLQYLYYLDQIGKCHTHDTLRSTLSLPVCANQYVRYIQSISGLAVSPVSNNFLFVRFAANPFGDFFR